ncbi:helix-turn-helix domain-containing protein, partial [Clostridium sp.]|uniref:helix-turn-helix domain-containing protein n=1 Tax=Clostridium sp. TaxID=1506 RepID=UPI003F7D195C
MKKLLKAYKVEIKPTTKQIQKINQSIGVCRWLYNEYLSRKYESLKLRNKKEKGEATRQNIQK